jgi:hypothetical protein
MRFVVTEELRLFEDSVGAAIGEWHGALEPALGTWLDDRDEALDSRLAAAGWEELWLGAGHGPAVAGGLALGRAVAPVCLIDEATLGAPLAVDGRVRHGARAETCATPLPGCGLALGRPAGDRVREATLDGTGTVRAALADMERVPDADARWRAWSAATLAYLAGLAEGALEPTIRYARNRKQFGRALTALPAVQARLADAAVAVDGLTLTAWNAAASSEERPLPSAALTWSGDTCRAVTATAHQVHGAVGFALETGLHRYYRRAKAVQVWTAAVCRASAPPS